ncbi:hypothetical protein TrRE_jg4539 [Triparma retinervis]|uniref:Uncharacterized protein n=1 Tax=Triparma retinervis TaxID=2557542 RepID=A0A9W7AEY7_9STRA|nr:hypothetical protein TrRE_jg4539 [Triparma retinervis]
MNTQAITYSSADSCYLFQQFTDGMIYKKAKEIREIREGKGRETKARDGLLSGHLSTGHLGTGHLGVPAGTNRRPKSPGLNTSASTTLGSDGCDSGTPPSITGSPRRSMRRMGSASNLSRQGSSNGGDEYGFFSHGSYTQGYEGAKEAAAIMQEFGEAETGEEGAGRGQEGNRRVRPLQRTAKQQQQAAAQQKRGQRPNNMDRMWTRGMPGDRVRGFQFRVGDVAWLVAHGMVEDEGPRGGGDGGNSSEKGSAPTSGAPCGTGRGRTNGNNADIAGFKPPSNLQLFSVALALPCTSHRALQALEPYWPPLLNLVTALLKEEERTGYVTLGARGLSAVVDEVVARRRNTEGRGGGVGEDIDDDDADGGWQYDEEEHRDIVNNATGWIKGEEELREEEGEEREEEVYLREGEGEEEMDRRARAKAKRMAKDLINIYHGFTNDSNRGSLGGGYEPEVDDTRFEGFEDGRVYGPSMSPASLLNLAEPSEKLTVVDLILRRTNKHVRINGRHVIDLETQSTLTSGGREVTAWDTILFPSIGPAGVLEQAGHLLQRTTVAVVKGCSPTTSIKAAAISNDINPQDAVEAARFLVEVGICVKARPIGMDSRYRVARRGGSLKLNALAQGFTERFRAALGGKAGNVPPIQVVVSEVTEGENYRKAKTLREVLDDICSAVGGGIILRAVRGEKGEEGGESPGGGEGAVITAWGKSPSFGALSSMGSFSALNNSPGRPDSTSSPRLFALSSSMDRSPGGPMARGYGSRGSPAPMSLGAPMMSFDEEEPKETEGGGGTGKAKGGGEKSKWKTEEITKAQGILLEMILWLRGKGVIEDIVLYVAEGKEELWGAGGEGGGGGGGGGEGEGWKKRLFTVLQQEGFLNGSSTDEIQEELGVDGESFVEFMKWGVECGKITVSTGRHGTCNGIEI